MLALQYAQHSDWNVQEHSHQEALHPTGTQESGKDAMDHYQDGNSL